MIASILSALRIIALYGAYLFAVVVAAALAGGKIRLSAGVGLILLAPPMLVWVHLRVATARRARERSVATHVVWDACDADRLGNAVAPTPTGAPSRSPLRGPQSVSSQVLPVTSRPEPAAQQPNPVSSRSEPVLSHSQRTTPEPATGWVPADACVVIAGRTIGGMVYVRHPRAANANSRACIDLKAAVAGEASDTEGRGLPYWPSYADIPPASRASYLAFLAGGRDDPAFGVGYMFLYFYGLERRFFADAPPDDEKRLIVAEVRKLRQAFGHSGSVRGYLDRFLDVAALVLDATDEQAPIFDHPGNEAPLALKLAIGARLARGEPLSSDWLLSWWCCHPERRTRTPASRCREEFHALFRHIFAARHPAGLALRAPKRRLNIEYRAASSEFSVNVAASVEGRELPDISVLKRPMTIAQEIADAAMDQLDALSRHLGRNPERRATLAAHALLPAALRDAFASDSIRALQSRLDGALAAAGGIIPAVELIELLSGARPDTIRIGALREAADALAAVGFGLAPDPWHALRSPKFGEPVILFKQPLNGQAKDEASESYRAGLLRITLGCFVAQADGSISPAEAARLVALIDDATELCAIERTRLSANLNWLLRVPPDMPSLRARLKQLSAADRGAIRDLAVEIAHADENVGAREVERLEAVYRALGIDRHELYADLHARRRSDDPVCVRPADAPQAGEAIPREAGSNSLDATRIAAIRQDTARASALLGAIFVADDEEPERQEQSDDASPPASTPYPGLDSSHTIFLTELLARDRWSEADFNALAARCRLMPGGCLETINEWSFSRFEEALIEAYDGYEVNAGLRARLHNEQDV